VTIRGGKVSLRGNSIHDGGVGVLVVGPVQPWIAHNSIARNRKAGLSATEGARPALSGNVFDRNKLELPAEMDIKPIRERNYFMGLPSGGRKQ
jgi:hypothetical protein